MTERITPSYRPQQVEKGAPCQVGCANCGDIRGWIGTVAQRGKTGLSRDEAFASAWRQITDVNPFPATLGRICPHPCESQCNRAELDEPLAINAMERFLGDYAIEAGLSLPRDRERSCTEWLGVVGAGPSGLSFAYQMARRGYRVTVYDAREKAGGMLRYGVPDYRLPQEILDAEIEKIIDLGVSLELNVCVGRDISLDTLRERHDSVYLGIGAQAGNRLPIEGGDGPSVWSGTDYLARLNQGEIIATGTRVVVIGGGNTAIDAARCARRGGAEVTLLYRRGRAEMPAIAHEVEDAIEEGVDLHTWASSMRIERMADGRIERIVACRTEPGELDATGRPRPVVVEGSEFIIEADTLIAALSQHPVLDGLESLRHDGDWLIADDGGRVDPGVIAGGDVLGPGIAGEAIVQGRRAAELLHARFRQREPEHFRPTEDGAISAKRVMLETKATAEPAQTPRMPVDKRLNNAMPEVDRTIDEDQFLREVERCFSCGLCSGCEQCAMYCTSSCFKPVENPGPGHYFTLDLEECRECGKCVEVCPCGFLEIE